MEDNLDDRKTEFLRYLGYLTDLLRDGEIIANLSESEKKIFDIISTELLRLMEL